MSAVVHYQVVDDVARVEIDRPELHNAFNDDVMHQLTQAFLAADVPEIRLVVLCSRGKSFCAGADVNWMKRMVEYSMDENIDDAMIMSRMLRTIRECPKPVIARIHGATIGGGVGLVAACDLAVALHSAVFALSEVRLGIVPAVISPFVLEKIGAAARRYALTAERFDAQEARRIGLISHVVDEEAELDAWIATIAQAIRSNGPQAITACKQILTEVVGADWTRAQTLTSRRIAEIRVSAEGQEGLKAFLEKRKPDWTSSAGDSGS